MPSNHKPGCACTTCRGHRDAEQRRLDEQAGELAAERRRLEEQAAVNRDLARAVMVMAVRHTSLPAPDALAALAGSVMGTALSFDPANVLRSAGVRVHRPAGGYQPDEAAARSASGQSRTAAMFAASPEHDPRVLKAIARGAADAEVGAVLTEVTQEYGQQAAERQARREPGVMWRTRSGEVLREGTAAPMGGTVGPAGIPVQRSVVHSGVPELGSEEV